MAERPNQASVWVTHRVPVAVGSLFCAILLNGLAGCAGSGGPEESPPGVSKYIDGVNKESAGDRAGAIASFNEAIQTNPSLRMAHIRLADLYRREGDYADAATQYEIATKLDPYSSSNAYNLGLCYQFLQRLSDAVAEYLRALHLQPTNAKATMNLGLVYLALGHATDAQSYLLKATQLDPKSSQTWSNYGVGLDAIGRFPEAESAYRHALELETGSIPTLQNLAANLIAQKKANESLAVCRELLLRTDTALSRTRYGEALALSGDKTAALEQYKLALARDPAFYLAMTQEGFLLIDEYHDGMELDEPKREAALALWRRSMQVNPNQPRVVAAMRQWQSGQLFGK